MAIKLTSARVMRKSNQFFLVNTINSFITPNPVHEKSTSYFSFLLNNSNNIQMIP